MSVTRHVTCVVGERFSTPSCQLQEHFANAPGPHQHSQLYRVPNTMGGSDSMVHIFNWMQIYWQVEGFENIRTLPDLKADSLENSIWIDFGKVSIVILTDKYGFDTCTYSYYELCWFAVKKKTLCLSITGISNKIHNIQSNWNY